MIFHVRYAHTAEIELDQAYRWLLEQSQSPKIAFKWYNSITQAIDSLDQNPHRCGLANENDYFTQEIRQFLHGKRSGRYRILFTVEGKTVIILHIRHGSRKQLDAKSFLDL